MNKVWSYLSSMDTQERENLSVKETDLHHRSTKKPKTQTESETFMELHDNTGVEKVDVTMEETSNEAGGVWAQRSFANVITERKAERKLYMGEGSDYDFADYEDLCEIQTEDGCAGAGVDQ